MLYCAIIVSFNDLKLKHQIKPSEPVLTGIDLIDKLLMYEMRIDMIPHHIYLDSKFVVEIKNFYIRGIF